MHSTRRIRQTAGKLYRLCLVDGRLDEDRVRQVAARLVQSGGRDGLGILAHFQRLVRFDRDRHAALVQSATPLADDLRESVRTGLARTYGPELRTSFEQKPELIAGMRVKVGSHVYDGSVQGKLAALKARL
jgi:F-type H+-transporting ATPase subunit delta